jgi:hypothetical protein
VYKYPIRPGNDALDPTLEKVPNGETRHDPEAFLQPTRREPGAYRSVKERAVNDGVYGTVASAPLGRTLNNSQIWLLLCERGNPPVLV